MIRYALLTLCLLASAVAEVVTVIDPYGKLPAGKTVVWSPLFQATWDAMNKEMGGKPAKIEPHNELMARLDAFDWDPEKVMPEGSWKTWAGEATQDFLEKVNAEAARMTGDATGPFTLGDPSPGALACFGLLDREVEFEKPFHKSVRQALWFGQEKRAVRFFGVRGELSAGYGASAKVLAYRPVDGSHALEVSCKGSDDKVIFYIPPKEQDFATACKWIREWRKTHDHEAGAHGQWNDRLLHEGDEVRVPYVSLDAKDDLSGQLVGDRHYGIAGDPWIIRRAEQRTRFELFEKGAKVRVEASIGLEPFSDAPPKAVPRRFIYDRPFFVFLWREHAKWPYLGVWIGNAAALHEMKQSVNPRLEHGGE